MDALYICASTAFYRISICLYMYVVIVIFVLPYGVIKNE